MSSFFKKFVIFLGDVILLYLSLALTLLIRYGPAEFKISFNTHLVPFSIIFVLWVLVLYLFDLYHYKTTRTAELLKTISYAVIVSGFLSITAFYLFPGVFGLTPKTNLVLFALIFLVFAYGWHRLMVFTIFPSGAQKIILLGNSPLIERAIEHIKSHQPIGYRVTEWFKDPEDATLNKVLEAASQHGAPFRGTKPPPREAVCSEVYLPPPCT